MVADRANVAPRPLTGAATWRM